ncbi:hypothetical protein NKH45_10720 [Mesorhizobium sp. M1156]|uniref:hypothetical protein n=1 Tax=Mesorhizobium sp. M1156 TaxID=2957064 RepID=UPI0033378D3E
MSELAIRHWHDTVERLRGGEPLRLLIGEKLYNSSEIMLAAPFAASLRKDLIADIEAQIAGLTEAQSAEGDKPDRASGLMARPSAASGEAATSEGQN